MIKVEGLTKRYARTVAVDNISFEVEKGRIVGFLGPNGAGKTTTMRILTCFLPPTRGSVEVAGFDVLNQPLEVKKRIGYLPETPPLYPEMEVIEYLNFVAALKGDSAIRGPGAGGAACWSAAPSATCATSSWASCPRATGSASGWRRPSSTIPMCWCSTSPRRAWIRSRSSTPGSSSRTWRAITRSFSARTSCPKWSRPASRSSSSTRASWWRRIRWRT